MIINSKDQIVTFGKHRGKSVKSIIKDDPQYLLWCSIHINWLDVDIKIREQCVIRIEAEQSNGDNYTGAPDSGWEYGLDCYPGGEYL